MYPNWCADAGEVVDAFSIGLEHIDATMGNTLAHVASCIGHPPGLMEGIATTLPIGNIMNVA